MINNDPDFIRNQLANKKNALFQHIAKRGHYVNIMKARTSTVDSALMQGLPAVDTIGVDRDVEYDSPMSFRLIFTKETNDVVGTEETYNSYSGLDLANNFDGKYCYINYDGVLPRKTKIEFVGLGVKMVIVEVKKHTLFSSIASYKLKRG